MSTLTENNSYALITGATRGIGRSIALGLAAAGYHLVLSARTAADLQQLTEEIRKAYPAIDVVYIAADCIDPQQVRNLAASVTAQIPHVDVLVNNVGLFKPGTLLEEAEDALSDHFMVNVWSTHYLSVFFGKQMCARKNGHIFNIGSIAGKTPFVKAASYSVTKHALHGLTGMMRKEWSPYGIKVTEIIPGATYTSSWEGVPVQEEKMVAASDIAAAILMCLSLSAGANVDELVIRPLDETV